MKAVFSMWKNTRMIILTAVCAAIYGAALIAFKTAIPLIPGITEVRVGAILPVPFGLLFGPAGAWGAAIGNLIGDLLGGTLGPGSAGGFAGNFLLAYLPYTLWTQWVPFHQKTREWKPGGIGPWVTYFLVTFISGRGLRGSHRDLGGRRGDRSLSGTDQDYHHQQYGGRLDRGYSADNGFWFH